jgi:hypothetical protein
MPGRLVSEAWKNLERRVAKSLGGKRLWRPDYGDSQPDGENELEVWDTKCYRRHAAVSLYLENEAKYRKFAGGRRFLLILFSRERHKQGEFVVLRLADYIDLKRKAGEIE